MGRAVLALIALLLAPTAQEPSLRVKPTVFSPRVGALTISASLDATDKVGVAVARLRGPALGWIERPAARSEVGLTWDGTLGGERLADGYYEVRLVAGGKTLATAPFRLDETPPRLEPLAVENGARPFAGDRGLLTTITPNGDGLRDRAEVRFRVSEFARVDLEVQRTARAAETIFADWWEFRPGLHTITWTPPATIAPRTYVLRLTATDLAGNRRTYGSDSAYVGRTFRAPVVRVLEVDAGFTQPSYAPGQLAALRVATDAPRISLQVFRVGPEERPTYLDDELSGVAVTEPRRLPWLLHSSAPETLRFRIGPWPSGLYYVEVRTPDERIGYAPFVLRPALWGASSRVAVVLPTQTWQAYNFYDADGDGWGDTWYAGGPQETVDLSRPFANRGVPPNFRRYDIGFLTWLARTGKTVDFLSEADLALVRSGDDLAARYDLIVFPGHTEYVTRHEYDLVERYRDRGGNLAFLSANSFFWSVRWRGSVLTRLGLWRDLGRPEARLLGAQYKANDTGRRQGLFVVRDVAAAPWLWEGTGLTEGSTFGEAVGGYGIEIDATTEDSPPTTRVLAEIPDLLGEGVTAQMTYYETRAGAKVFAAGVLDFGDSAMTWPVSRMLENLWARLSRP